MYLSHVHRGFIVRFSISYTSTDTLFLLSRTGIPKLEVTVTDVGHACRTAGHGGRPVPACYTLNYTVMIYTVPHGLLSVTHGRAELALVRNDYNSLPDSSVGRALG